MFKARKTLDKKTNPTLDSSPLLPSQKQERQVFAGIDDNFSFLNDLLGNAIGLIKQKYSLADEKNQIGIAYIDSIANKEYVSKEVIGPLLTSEIKASRKSLVALIQSKLTFIPDTKTSREMKDVTEALLRGNTILFIEGIDTAIIIGSTKLEKRSVDKPENEPSLFGSMDAFIEDIETNCSLIIRRLPNPDLRFEEFTVGKLSRTKVKLLWIENISNPSAVAEARRRLQSVDVDAVNGIGELALLIEDNPWSVFPKARQSQRPDITVKYLTDGHFAIFCANNPYAFLAPITFWDNFKTADDYSERSLVSSYNRIIRFLAFFLSIIISPLYLSFVTYHHAVVPPSLAANIASGRQGVPPFPSVVELLLLTAIIGIIREAAIRIPSSVGFFVGIFGAVVIGQSAVTAGYVTASVIIVVAVSAIAAFGFSSLTMVIPTRLINYFLILCSAFLGMYGLTNGVALVIWHMTCQKSFGVPYLYPVVPLDREALKDTLVRFPYSSLTKRFEMLSKNNQRRMGRQGMKH